MNRNRILLHNPGLRGALFYGAYWGAIGVFEPFMNVYFLRAGATGEQIGWLAAILPLCTVALAPMVARLADRTRSRVRLLGLACAGFGAAVMLPSFPAFQPTFAGMVVFMTLFAIFRSPIASLADSLIASMAVRHALDFGAMRLWGSFLFTLTAIGLGAIWASTGFRVMFLVGGLCFLPVVLAALRLEESQPAQPPPAPSGPPAAGPLQQPSAAFGLRSSTASGLVFLLASTFLVIAGLFMAGNFGSIYMVQLGGNETLVGAMMGIAALGEVPGMLAGSRVARRIGETNALVIGYLLNAAGLAGYALTLTPWVLLIFSALRGLGFGLVLVSTVMIINTRAPREFTSTYQGIFNAACWGLAPLLGGPISGWIFQNFGAPSLFFLAAILTLFSAALILPTYRIWKSTRISRPSLSSEP